MQSPLKSDIHKIEELREFPEAPRLFWPAFNEAMAGLLDSMRARVLHRDHADAQLAWKRLAAWSRPESSRSTLSDPEIESLAQRALLEGIAEQSTPFSKWVAINLKTGLPTSDCVFVAELPRTEETIQAEKIRQALLVADTPAIYRNYRNLRQSQNDIVSFAATLDLLVIINRYKKFGAACLSLANEMASRYGATLAAVGWQDGGYIRLCGLSHIEKFDKKMERIQRIEAAMEEAFVQDDEILHPPNMDSLRITRDHEILAQQEAARYLLSVPLRLEGRPVAVITLLRTDQPFTETEVRNLRVVADQVVKPLDAIRRQDKWIGAKIVEAGRDFARSHWNIEHPWYKLGAIFLLIGILVLFFGRITYRVEAAFIVRPQQQALLPAPFDGYVKSVFVQTGDTVEAGTVLVQLEDAELLLEKASQEADIRRFQSEAEQRRAANALAEMKIALAQMEQSQAALAETEYRLRISAIQSPFPAIVAEDSRLKERIGSAVKAGDILLRLTRMDQLYLELDVNERDIHEIRMGAGGEVAFTSQPGKKFPIQVLGIEPVAVPKKENNVFLVRADFQAQAEQWWRPGMTGVAKIEVGPRTFFWIFTHRLIDFLHLKLWLF